MCVRCAEADEGDSKLEFSNVVRVSAFVHVMSVLLNGNNNHQISGSFNTLRSPVSKSFHDAHLVFAPGSLVISSVGAFVEAFHMFFRASKIMRKENPIAQSVRRRRCSLSGPRLTRVNLNELFCLLLHFYPETTSRAATNIQLDFH
jgi:hypothetical protein